jgi:hypothetical protein
MHHLEDFLMNRPKWFEHRPQSKKRIAKARLQVEQLENRNLLSGVTLTALSQVSDPNPLPLPASTSPTVFPDSEVEPQIAVDPTNLAHAVAIWQQDRFRSVGGARALVVSVTYNANAIGGATWSAPTAIPYFNSTDPLGSAYARYTDPWVTIAPNGDVYAVALAMTPVGPVPGHTAVQVSKSTDGGATWSAPTTLIQTDAPPGTDPADLANDKEMVIADPKNSNNVYVVWDRLNHPSDLQNFNAAHGVPFREDMMFARTTDGGATWIGSNGPAAVTGFPASDITNFQANESAFGNEIVVLPDANGTLVDIFTDATGSGKQATQADHNVLGVMRSTDHGATWSAIIDGPAIETVGVTDPDTGAPVRSGEPLTSVAVDPNNGNLYAVWADARFSSKFSTDGVAFSMSTDGGLTWSNPIQINQTPTTIPAGDQQAFTPTVAVNSSGTVAVTYYDFRNNTAGPGLLTDYFIAVNPNPGSNPTNWSETQLTTTSFNLENAAPTSRGYFLGDYQGLAAAGNNFYALFAQAGSSTSDPSNIWFRDPPPAAEIAPALAAPAAVAPAPLAPASAGTLGVDAVAALETQTTSSSIGTGMARASERPSEVDPVPLMTDNASPLTMPAVPSAEIQPSGGGSSASDGDALLDGISSDALDDPMSD